MNQRFKSGKTSNRDWYQDVSFYEIENVLVESLVEVVQEVVEFARNVGADCAVCGEAFDRFWGDDQEEWMVRNCLVKDGQGVHATCL